MWQAWGTAGTHTPVGKTRSNTPTLSIHPGPTPAQTRPANMVQRAVIYSWVKVSSLVAASLSPLSYPQYLEWCLAHRSLPKICCIDG